MIRGAVGMTKEFPMKLLQREFNYFVLPVSFGDKHEMHKM